MAPEAQSGAEQVGRAVALTVPAKPHYVVLARLALSAVCRLTSLGPEEVADLKLAVTEAAAGLLPEGVPPGARFPRLSLEIELDEEKLVLDLTDGGARIARPPARPGPAGEPTADGQELNDAILAATVDDRRHGEGWVRLVKYLSPETK